MERRNGLKFKIKVAIFWIIFKFLKLIRAI